MRNIIGDLAQGFHQNLDAIEHSIERIGQTVKVVVSTAQWDARVKLPADDRFGRLSDGVNPPQKGDAE